MLLARQIRIAGPHFCRSIGSDLLDGEPSLHPGQRPERTTTDIGASKAMRTPNIRSELTGPFIWAAFLLWGHARCSPNLRWPGGADAPISENQSWPSRYGSKTAAGYIGQRVWQNSLLRIVPRAGSLLILTHQRLLRRTAKRWLNLCSRNRHSFW